MPSGRIGRRAPDDHRTVGWMKRVFFAVMACILLAVLPGCSNRPVSFEVLLARIDALGPQATTKTFADAAALAGTSTEKLRLLKRARILDVEVAADTALVFTKSGISTVVGLAALDAFMEAERFETALQLFHAVLPVADFPFVFAEVFVRAKQADVVYKFSALDRSWLIQAYDATGWSEFLYEAILGSLETSDTGAARIMLDEYVSKGFLRGIRPAIDLLWHHGFMDLILALGPADTGFDALAVYADSAYLTGHKALATSVYAELIARYPLYSWKPYAALARLAEQSSMEYEDYRLPLAPPRPQRNPEAGYWYAMMLDRFPEDDLASLEFGLWLVRQGSIAEAEPYFKGGSLLAGQSSGAEPARGTGNMAGKGVATDSAFLALAGQEYLPIAAIELAAIYPDLALAVDSALAALFFSASWNRFLSLNSRREVDVPRAWFWNAASLALAADFEAAVQLLQQSSPMEPGFEVSYSKAAYELASGRYEDAASSYLLAARKAASASARARCLVRVGDSLSAAGELSAAINAYTSALGLEAFNTEAMAALRRLPTP